MTALAKISRPLSDTQLAVLTAQHLVLAKATQRVQRAVRAAEAQQAILGQHMTLVRDALRVPADVAVEVDLHQGTFTWEAPQPVAETNGPETESGDRPNAD